jgi:hypothetical protein
MPARRRSSASASIAAPSASVKASGGSPSMSEALRPSISARLSLTDTVRSSWSKTQTPSRPCSIIQR